MKTRITFEWNDADYDHDRGAIESEQQIILNRDRYICALWDISSYLRNLSKHGILNSGHELTDENYEIVARICDDLIELIPELPS